MRVITYLECEEDYIYVSIFKKEYIEHKYKLSRGSPSFIRLAKILGYYASTAYMRLFPDGTFSFVLEGNPYG